MILQQAWLLIGGSSSEPITVEDTAEASSILKLYQQELIEKKIPIRYMTHASQHIVEDVINYKCGAERNAAWMFENIQHIFTRALRTGFKPVAQIRNRFIERYKYRLPTLGNGTVMNCYDLFQEEVEKASFVQSKAQVVTKWKIGKGSNPKKSLSLPTYTITNKFPNNVLLLKDDTVVVVENIIECPPNSKVMKIIGRSFDVLEPAHPKPAQPDLFLSTRFNIYLASKLSLVGEWNINFIKAKMFVVPYNPTDCHVLPNIESDPVKWYVSPLRHTLKK
jgi:hypothetical protein